MRKIRAVTGVADVLNLSEGSIVGRALAWWPQQVLNGRGGGRI